MAKQKKIIIACVSTYPPRQCGIGTFSADLVAAYNQFLFPDVRMRVVAMQAPGEKFNYPADVFLTIRQDNPLSYAQAARNLNNNKSVGLVCIQHEFGIFGGPWGEYLEIFLKTIKKPVVITMHTVLPRPNAEVLNRVVNLAARARGLVVMTRHSKQILISDYGISEQKITVIPHGIHPRPYLSPAQAKALLRLPNVPTLCTFGLLSPNKGVEYILQSLPPVVRKFPNLRYLIIGPTHPNVKATQGEVYREYLTALAGRLGLNGRVEFVDKFLKTKVLMEFLQAADIYLSGSLDPNQAVSGTLTYALGAGRPVISTQFPQAQEEVLPHAGLLVDFRKPEEFTQALLKLLEDEGLRTSLGKDAYFKTRHMVWPNVALAYAKYFANFVPAMTRQNKNLPPVNLKHLCELTDNFGMFQFAQLHVSDPKHGYVLDDNARALIAMIRHYQKYGQDSVLPLIRIYLKFIKSAAAKDGSFHNYFTCARVVDLRADMQSSLEDANARALQALMMAAGSRLLPKKLREAANELRGPDFSRRFNWPRPIAFYICGLYCLRGRAGARQAIVQNCDALISHFRQNSGGDWIWFEQKLTYSNAILPQALLLGYIATGKKEYFEVGRKTLDFLISQTFVDGMYMGIGQSGWYERGNAPARFDQQPEDPAAMVQALKTMYLITGLQKYKKLMCSAFNWFLGDNVLGQFVYDQVTGGSYDGISEKTVNLNQGAESSISYLLARLEL